MITRHGSPFGNCGWGSPGLDYDRINKEGKKAQRESARKLAAELRAKRFQKTFKEQLSLAVSIAICRQLVKELGAKKSDQVLGNCDSKELTKLAEKYQ